MKAHVQTQLRGVGLGHSQGVCAGVDRVHVRIGLPQHYMLGAMNVVRNEAMLRIDEHVADALRAIADAHASLPVPPQVGSVMQLPPPRT